MGIDVRSLEEQSEYQWLQLYRLLVTQKLILTGVLATHTRTYYYY